LAKWVKTILTPTVNHDTGNVVWCAEGHGRKVFDSFFGQLTDEQRAAIELVSGDGARWIDEAVAEWCPQAGRCVDTFHVVSWATDALDEVRRQAWREANKKAKAAPKRKRGRPKAGEEANPEKKGAKAVRGLRYPLLKNPEDLTERQAADLEMAAISNPRLYRAYLLKEGLRLALKLPADQVRDAVGEWRGRAWRSRIPEFVELQRKVKRHMDAIVATAEHGITNARVESVNNGIKLIVKMAYGYRNFDNLRAMVMLKHSGLPIELPGRPAKEKKMERKAA
jgi:transposase